MKRTNTKYKAIVEDIINSLDDLDNYLVNQCEGANTKDAVDVARHNNRYGGLCIVKDSIAKILNRYEYKKN